MNDYLENAFGVIKAIPDVMKAGQILWEKLKPPAKAIVEDPKDGISGNTFYSQDLKFAISIPGDEWWFWRPSIAFLLTMGPLFNRPTSATPILIFSKQVINLFRPNVVVTVEEVGQFTNIREMIELSGLMLQSSGITIDAADVVVDDANQSGMLGFTQPYHFGNTLCTVQHFHLFKGMFYAITATYVPNANANKKPLGSLQSILNSFKFVEGEDEDQDKD